MLFLLFFFSLFHQSFEAEVPICRAVNYSGYIYPTKNDFRNSKVYKYNFIITVSINKENITYPNILTISNHTYWSMNDSLYYPTSPLYFNLDYSNKNVLRCLKKYENCTIPYPNKSLEQMRFDFNATLKNKEIKNYVIYDYSFLVVHNGTFIGNSPVLGQLMDPRIDPCINSKGFGAGYKEYMYSSMACCIQYDYIEIPDSVDYICENFETRVNVTDFDHNETSNFMAHARISSDLLETKATYLKCSSSSCKYHITNPFYYCWGNYSNPYSTCTIKTRKGDFQYVFTYNHLSHYPNYKRNYFNKWIQREGVAGIIIKRNGILFKDYSHPYTQSNPCWYGKTGVVGMNATISSSFCCTRFVPSLMKTSTKSVTTKITPKFPTITTTFKTLPMPVTSKLKPDGQKTTRTLKISTETATAKVQTSTSLSVSSFLRDILLSFLCSFC